MFNEKERLLANEARLTSSLLGNGLNSLRKADIYNKGLYYQSFFSLSIGIERLLKIIIITRHRCENNGEFPENINLRGFSHDLTKLCEYIGIQFEENTLHSRIVSFLSDFAKKSRYYNLDSIINQHAAYNDPLGEWDLIAQDIYQSHAGKKTIKNKQVLANYLDQVSVIRFYDLQGNEINNGIELLDEAQSREIIQSYSVQYIFEIITKLVSGIRTLERKKYLMPVLSEFFIVYHPNMKPYEIRRKKDWLRI